MDPMEWRLLTHSLFEFRDETAAVLASPRFLGAAWQAALILGASIPLLAHASSDGRTPRTFVGRAPARWITLAGVALLAASSATAAVPLALPVFAFGAAAAWSVGLFLGEGVEALVARPVGVSPARDRTRGRARWSLDDTRGLAVLHTPRGRRGVLLVGLHLAAMALACAIFAVDGADAWLAFAVPAAASVVFGSGPGVLPLVGSVRRRWLRHEYRRWLRRRGPADTSAARAA